MSLRLFVALEPPDPVRRRLAAAQEGLRSASGRHADEIRWVAPDRMHLTLQFLGAVPEEQLDAVRVALAGAAAAGCPLRLEVRGAGGFPSARRPRAVWCGVAGDLERLQALVIGLGLALGPLGFPASLRTFAPHFTLGRSRDGRGVSGLGEAIDAVAGAGAASWRADEVVLFRSLPAPGGSRYEPLLRAPLGCPGEGPG